MLTSHEQPIPGKEKANILLAWVVVLKRSIIGFPIRYMKFDEPVPVQAGIGDVILGLQKVQNADGLVLESGSGTRMTVPVVCRSIRLETPGR